MILPEHIIAMLNHWLQTPVNGYFGSSYGADLNSLLLRPLSTATADIFIQKLKRDVPILNDLDLGISSSNAGFERKQIYLTIGTKNLINLSQFQQNTNTRFNPNEEFVDANAN